MVGLGHQRGSLLKIDQATSVACRPIIAAYATFTHCTYTCFTVMGRHGSKFWRQKHEIIPKPYSRQSKPYGRISKIRLNSLNRNYAEQLFW